MASGTTLLFEDMQHPRQLLQCPQLPLPCAARELRSKSAEAYLHGLYSRVYAGNVELQVPAMSMLETDAW